MLRTADHVVSATLLERAGKYEQKRRGKYGKTPRVEAAKLRYPNRDLRCRFPRRVAVLRFRASSRNSHQSGINTNRSESAQK